MVHLLRLVVVLWRHTEGLGAGSAPRGDTPRALLSSSGPLPTFL